MTQSTLRTGPDANGLFGSFGGRYVAETLMPLILDLDREYELAKKDPEFIKELAYFQRDYVGRPSPLYFAERLTAPWVTCSCSAAWLTLFSRAAASKARKALSGGRSWLMVSVSFPDRLRRSYRFSA